MHEKALPPHRIVQKTRPVVRLLEAGDIPHIARAFDELGWNKPASQYERYLIEQEHKVLDVYVALLEGQFAGYLAVCWKSGYEPFFEKGIPEIVDFNVLPKFRRMGIGSHLMDQAESAAATVSPVVGIGVGMTRDYGAAQRLYVLRGYVPDGLGLHSRGHPVCFGDQVCVDDELALYLTKGLR